MKPNPNLDELLCSFMDGELSPRQRTEVQRMAAHDAQVARRLQQLQNCRSLFCALPADKAPSDLLEQIKVSLERHSLLQEQPAVRRRSIGAWQLAFRRLVAAAAVIALMGVLGVVIYQIVAPVPPGGIAPGVRQPQPLWKRARSNYRDSADGGRCRFYRPAGAANGPAVKCGYVRRPRYRE